jgi:hypothetical protein
MSRMSITCIDLAGVSGNTVGENRRLQRKLETAGHSHHQGRRQDLERGSFSKKSSRIFTFNFKDFSQKGIVRIPPNLQVTHSFVYQSPQLHVGPGGPHNIFPLIIFPMMNGTIVNEKKSNQIYLTKYARGMLDIQGLQSDRPLVRL